MRRQTIVTPATGLFRRLFSNAATEPRAWQASADSLLRAARAMIPLMERDTSVASDPAAVSFDPPVAPVYMLLVGLAVENLAKGVQVARMQAALSGDKLAKDLKTHSLFDLLKDVGLELDEYDAYLVERLEVFVAWAGRYPIPTRLEGFLPRTHPSGGSGPLPSFDSGDPIRAEAIVRRLRLTI